VRAWRVRRARKWKAGKEVEGRRVAERAGGREDRRVGRMETDGNRWGRVAKDEQDEDGRLRQFNSFMCVVGRSTISVIYFNALWGGALQRVVGRRYY
jgi:hypothetical protein